ncbi:cell envelope integrity protein TolA [Paraburkholderia fungorum]|nr:cell envelope integrity protein TolA [Paraburkholderia fungorum]MBB4516562.1 colicin import membrane protein [Paraburkholderia fungorum]MBB5545181.1 colicin import membrane protein [Paraburkholderia fungorum]MBB6204965.1 colicin import membrane protein [Paraburkholderia fungorum]MDE1006139.1 cell envelope integrity protein TolA [Paraburkholderia fungorum]USU22007.1 TonB family protein [Paraburkholderia fungorum]
MDTKYEGAVMVRLMSWAKSHNVKRTGLRVRSHATGIPGFPLRPPRARGIWLAFLLALTTHALLALFLFNGIRWQSRTPARADAQLWSAVPDMAPPHPQAPPAPAQLIPPPTHDEQADITLRERQRRKQVAAPRAAPTKPERQTAGQQQQSQLKREQAEQPLTTAQRMAEQQRELDVKQMSQMSREQAKQAAEQERTARLAALQAMAAEQPSAKGGLANRGTGSGGTAPSADYADRVRQRVRPNIIAPGAIEGNPVTVIAVRLRPGGVLLGATIQRSSGNAQWDDIALRAVQKSDPMPLDVNGQTPASFLITLQPKDGGG